MGALSTIRNRSFRLWLFWVLAYWVVCLFIDLCPTHGPPHFRYNGSDPSHEVWNIGWPLALFIWDDRFGLLTSPFSVIMIGGQVLVFLFVFIPLAIVLRRFDSE